MIYDDLGVPPMETPIWILDVKVQSWRLHHFDSSTAAHSHAGEQGARALKLFTLFLQHVEVSITISRYKRVWKQTTYLRWKCEIVSIRYLKKVKKVNVLS